MLEDAITKLTTEVERLREAIEQSNHTAGTPLAVRPSALLLRATEAASLLGISRTKIYALLASGRLPSVRLGRSIRIPSHALKRAINGDQASSESMASPVRR